MVVFASGIVDERLPVGVVGLSTTFHRFVRWWVWNLAGWFLLVVLAHCWVLKDHAIPSGPPSLKLHVECGGGVGGCGVWLLNSGREHPASASFRACWFVEQYRDRYPSSVIIAGGVFLCLVFCVGRTH
jgi:hypothetical protein